MAWVVVILKFVDGLYWSSFGLMAALAIGITCASKSQGTRSWKARLEKETPIT